MVVFWVFYPKLITFMFPTTGASPTDKGVFGDMFGSLNALFSGVALVGIIYAVLMQCQELKLQRAELEETRKELKRTADSQKEASETLNNQLKEMQEQTELQLRPFVITKYDDNPEYANSSLIVANVGNCTAVNINIYNATKGHRIHFYASTLEKSQTERLGSSSIVEDLYNNKLIINFQNMKNKDYHVIETILKNTHHVKEFRDGKHKLDHSPDS